MRTSTERRAPEAINGSYNVGFFQVEGCDRSDLPTPTTPNQDTRGHVYDALKLGRRSILLVSTDLMLNIVMILQSSSKGCLPESHPNPQSLTRCDRDGVLLLQAVEISLVDSTLEYFGISDALTLKLGALLMESIRDGTENISQK